MQLDDATVKVISAVLATLSAVIVAWIANRRSKAIAAAPEMPRTHSSVEIENVQHNSTRELIRDVRGEMRDRFDKLDEKIVGDPDLRELAKKLDNLPHS
jgi:DNA polymerase II small subunit/DNA polymerase delta subunit B